MLTIDQIQQMTPEEISAMNRKLVVRLVLTRIVAPIVAIAAVHVAANYIEKKLDQREDA